MIGLDIIAGHIHLHMEAIANLCYRVCSLRSIDQAEVGVERTVQRQMFELRIVGEMVKTLIIGSL